MNIKDLIGEATEYDKKQALEEKKPKSWCKSVSAFANGIGGTLIFGVTNDDQIVGLTNAEHDAEVISEQIKTRLDPIPEFHISFIKTDNNKILILLNISGGEETPYYYAADGVMEAFVRFGNESVKANATELKRLVLRGKNSSFDALSTTYQMSDYSFSKLKERYKSWTGVSLDEKEFVSFGLVDNKGMLTNAGALLADDSPIRWSRIFCTRWNGLTKGGGVTDALDDAEFSGSLITLLNEGVAFIKRNMYTKWKKTADSRIDMPDYCERSYFEALVNSLVHRDYLVNGSEVHIDIFDDRLRIYSPGGMPDGTLVQNRIIDAIPSTRRNPVLADVFQRLGYMERKGSGLIKIIESYTNAYNYSEEKKPQFESSRVEFTVTLMNLNYDNGEVMKIQNGADGAKNGADGAKNGADGAKNKLVDGKDLQELLLEILKEDQDVTQIELANITGVSRRTIQRIMEEMINDKKLRRIGSARSGHWEVL